MGLIRALHIGRLVAASATVAASVLILIVGHTPPGSVFWTGAGLLALYIFIVSLPLWLLCDLTRAIIEKRNRHGKTERL